MGGGKPSATMTTRKARTALSSVASALRRLPQYSGSLHGLELKEDPVFADAQARAQQLARVTKRHVASDAMTAAQYESMRTSIKDSRVRLLFARTDIL